jgi:hypothetical protein
MEWDELDNHVELGKCVLFWYMLKKVEETIGYNVDFYVMYPTLGVKPFVEALKSMVGGNKIEY